MEEYWQKKPLFVRGAIPAFALAQAQKNALESPISAQELIKLSSSEDVEARLVKSKPWRLEKGPFKSKTIPSLNAKDWTLLVQGMDTHHPAAETILSWFRFIPDSRLDDLMISLAGPGGGVGPHLDSYDVFLLQMSGRRHWRISEQTNHELVEDVPLKILANFKKEQEWIVEPGDLLYLPPKVAHDGIALDPGTQTWSVGFRSPSWKELLQETLWRLADSLETEDALNALISDPEQKATATPAILQSSLVKKLEKQLEKLSIKGKKLNDLASTSLGEVLSDPKPHIIFNPPNNPLDFEDFVSQSKRQGLKTSSKTRLILDTNTVYCNGEQFAFKKDSKKAFVAWEIFANQRNLSAKQCQQFSKLEEFYELIYEGYLDGWFELIQANK